MLQHRVTPVASSPAYSDLEDAVVELAEIITEG